MEMRVDDVRIGPRFLRGWAQTDVERSTLLFCQDHCRAVSVVAPGP
jgi:hypothetical protein